MSIKKQRRKLIKKLVKKEEKALIKRVRYEYRKGRPCYTLDYYELKHLSMPQADKVIKNYLDKQNIKFETKKVNYHISLSTDDIDRIYYDFIDEEN